MNITLDFTQNNSIANAAKEQPIAVMPAELAKKLLKMYAEKLQRSFEGDIIDNHIKTLKDYRDANNLQGAIDASLSWIAERELIDNISAGNWDAYTVSTAEPALV